MAGVNPGEAAGGVLGGRVILAGGEGDELQRGGPPGDIVAQPAAVVGFDWRRQTAVEKLFRFLVGKGQLLAANLQKLIADAQVGNAQLRQVTRQHHQGHILRLMAQEKAHRVMDHRIIDQMVIVNDEIQRALPVGKFNKQLRKKRGEAGVLALLHHRFTGRAVVAGGLLDRRDQIAGKTLLLIVAFVQRKPPEIVFTRGPLRNERCFTVPGRAGDQHETIIVRAGKFRQ